MAADVTRPCARCEAAMPPGARFCPSCGAAQDLAPSEERRLVTVLFGDLTGFTELSERLDAEEVKRIVDGAFARVTEIVEAFGGRVDKIIGDEVMAVFGAPVAHEDDPERAVRAALEMQRMLGAPTQAAGAARGVDVLMHIGINTGEVVAGTVGRTDAYTVIGDAVNTARRIEEEAGAGQIFVGETTYEATRSAIEYRRLGQVTVKGKARPIAVWEALAERALPGRRDARRAPLIGREEELAVLDAFTCIVRRDRRPVAVALIGEAGMGKTRLIEEFDRRVREQGARVAHGRSLPYGTSSPAFAVQAMVGSVLGLDGSPSIDETETRVRDRASELGLAGEADSLLALLGLGTAPPREQASTGPAATSAPAQPSSVVLDAARALLERVADAEGFLALAFHELHWASDAVLDFVDGLVRSARAPLLVISLARPALLERRPGWSSGPDATLLTLGALGRDRAERLLDALAPALPPVVRERVLDRAGGNPLYLEELAHLLTEQDAAPGDALVPVGVHALVAARLDALPPALKRVVTDAAIVGAEFWAEALARAGDGDAPVAALDSLRALGVVEPAPASSIPGVRAYAFAQTVVREVAYGSVPKHARAARHGQIAAWLEERATGAERDLSDLVALHYERAALLAREVGDVLPEAEAKARRFLERAGDRALALDAADAAADLYERALAFTAGGTDALGLRLHLGEALVGVWRHEPAEEHLTAALDHARRLGERGIEGKALRVLGDLYRMRGEHERAREPLEHALAIAKETGDAREEAEGLRSHGLLDLHRGMWSAATLWFRQALARYRHPTLDDPRGEGWSLQNLGWANLLLGRLDEALAYLDEGQALFSERGDLDGAGWCLSLKSWVLLLRGDLSEADKIATDLESLLAVQPRGLGSLELDAQRIMRSYVAALRGRLAESEGFASAVLASVRRYRAPWVHGLATYPRVYVAMQRRRYADARVAIEDGARAAEASGDPLYLDQFAFARAWLAVEEGRTPDAEQAILTCVHPGGFPEPEGAGMRWILARARALQGRAADARALLEADPGRQGISLVHPATSRAFLAELMAEAGEPAGAIEVARAAVDEAGECLLARADALRTLASAQLAAGDANAAEAAIRQELTLLDEMDHDVERVRALAILARTLDVARRHDEAADAFDRARGLLDALPPGTDTAPLEASLRA